MRDLAGTTEDIARRVAARNEVRLARLSASGLRRRNRAVARAVGRMLAAAIAVIVAAVAWGLAVGPIGTTGVMALALTLALAWVAILALSRAPAPTVAALAQSDLPLLPQRTEEWLERQRPLLPAPAMQLVDGIGLRLETLAPQLATVDPQDPVASELRKLLATELPELVDGYARVPAALRREMRDGESPDRQLLDGLRVVDDQLARATERLASGDLHKLATQGRYLELKYSDAPGLEERG